MAGVQTAQITRRNSIHPQLGRRVPSSNDDFFEVDQLKKLRDYVRPLRRSRRLQTLATTVLELWLVFIVDLPARIADGTALAWPLTLVLIAAALDLAATAVRAPFSYWVNLVYEKRAGYSTMTLATWIKDQVLEFALGVVIAAALLVPVYAAIRAIDAWWIVGSLAIVALQITMAFVGPVLIMPRFNKFTPLADGPIRSRIEEIATLSGVEIEGVYLMDASKRTTRPNAGVTGFGKTKRVVVNDTICDFPLEELSQVIAHEVGHYRLHHIIKAFPVSALQFPLVLLLIELVAGNRTVLDWAGVTSLGDPASFGVFSVVFGLGMTIASLPQMWVSRKHEREADLEALELLGDPTSFVGVWPRLVLATNANLEQTTWERAKSTHPGIAERMQFGIDWARQNDVPVTVPPKLAVPERTETDKPAPAS